MPVSSLNDYRRVMREFMSFLDEVEHIKENMPDGERLASIKPSEMMRFG